jgi:hypothetical protein
MPIRADHNLYPGINPHLNSALQQPGGGWQSFHTYHLIMLAQQLNSALPGAYYAEAEASLQIRVYDPPAERDSPHRPDVLISRLAGEPVTEAVAIINPAPTQVLALDEALDPFEELVALVIYHDNRPVTRIELLSPANKPPGSYYTTYIGKRAEALHGGLCVVEIDFLHERRPTLTSIDDYSAGETGALPYHILIMDPRLMREEGPIKEYSFGLLDSVPVLNLPLDGKDVVPVDFGSIYDQTLRQRPYLYKIDYAQEPANMSAYTPADQSAIRARMAQIAQEYGA